MIEYHRTIKIMLIKTYLLSWKHFCVYREKNRNASRTVYGPAARGVWPAAGLARSGGMVTALSRARPAARGRRSSARCSPVPAIELGRQTRRLRRVARTAVCSA